MDVWIVIGGAVDADYRRSDNGSKAVAGSRRSAYAISSDQRADAIAAVAVDVSRGIACDDRSAVVIADQPANIVGWAAVAAAIDGREGIACDNSSAIFVYADDTSNTIRNLIASDAAAAGGSSREARDNYGRYSSQPERRRHQALHGRRRRLRSRSLR